MICTGGAGRDDTHEGHQSLTGGQFPFLEKEKTCRLQMKKKNVKKVPRLVPARDPIFQQDHSLTLISHSYPHSHLDGSLPNDQSIERSKT